MAQIEQECCQRHCGINPKQKAALLQLQKAHGKASMKIRAKLKLLPSTSGRLTSSFRVLARSCAKLNVLSLSRDFEAQTTREA